MAQAERSPKMRTSMGALAQEDKDSESPTHSRPKAEEGQDEERRGKVQELYGLK